MYTIKLTSEDIAENPEWNVQAGRKIPKNTQSEKQYCSNAQEIQMLWLKTFLNDVWGWTKNWLEWDSNQRPPD